MAKLNWEKNRAAQRGADEDRAERFDNTLDYFQQKKYYKRKPYVPPSANDEESQQILQACLKGLNR
jgi:hypothetical protein